MPSNQINDWQEIGPPGFNTKTQEGKNNAIKYLYADEPDDWQEIGAQKQVIETSLPEQPESSVLSDIMLKRGNELADNIVAYRNNDITGPELGLRFIGKAGAGTANDIVGAGINAAVPDVVKQGLSTGAQATADALDDTNAGQYFGDKLMQARDLYDRFSKSNPRLMSNVESAGNIATFVPTAQGAAKFANQTADALGSAKKGIEGLSNAYAAKYPKAPVQNVRQEISPDLLEAGAKLRYETADKMKGLLKPTAVDSTIDKIKSGSGYQTPEGMAFAGENAVTDTIKRLDTLRGKPISLAGLDEIDGRIRSDISKAIRAGDNETVSGLMSIRDELRNARLNVKPDDIVNPQAFNEWRKGDELWSAKNKAQDLQDIIENAYMTDNPATAMRTGFRALSKQLRKNPRGYTAEEITTINRAAKTGVLTGTLKTMGSRLISGMIGMTAGAVGGGPVGAVAGAAIGEAVGYPMRAVANALQESRAMAPIRAVTARTQVMQALPQSIQEISKLPMAQQKAAIENLWRQKKTTTQLTQVQLN